MAGIAADFRNAIRKTMGVCWQHLLRTEKTVSHVFETLVSFLCSFSVTCTLVHVVFCFLYNSAFFAMIICANEICLKVVKTSNCVQFLPFFSSLQHFPTRPVELSADWLKFNFACFWIG